MHSMSVLRAMLLALGLLATTAQAADEAQLIE
jgi:hypothetical protein